MGRRRRGLQHMIATKDQLLEQCKPPNISWRRYMEHCELAVSNSVIKIREKKWRSTRVCKVF